MPQPVLDLGLLSAASKDADVGRGEESKFDDVMALQEEPIKINFLLPDDSTVTNEFKKDHTIAVLKTFLLDEYDLKQEQTQLCLNGRTLLDPFSLTDLLPVRLGSVGDRHPSEAQQQETNIMSC